MKLVTFASKGGKKGQAMIGALLDDNSVLSLQPAAALYLKEGKREKDPYAAASRYIPADMVAFLERGKTALDLARRTVKAASQWQKAEKKPLKGLRKEPLIFPLTKVLLKSPVPRPGKIIAMGLNFECEAASAGAGKSS